MISIRDGNKLILTVELFTVGMYELRFGVYRPKAFDSNLTRWPFNMFAILFIKIGLALNGESLKTRIL